MKRRAAQDWFIHACVMTGFHCVTNAVVAGAGAAWVVADDAKPAPASAAPNTGATPSRADVTASASWWSAAMCDEQSSRVVASLPSVRSPADCGL